MIRVAPHVTHPLYCDMKTDGGGWTLVSVVLSDSSSDCDKYPVDGQSVEQLGFRTGQWASLSQREMDAFFLSGNATVVRVESRGSVEKKFFLSKPAATKSFSVFHAIRDVREWGACGGDYRLSDRPAQYDRVTNKVTHDGGCMQHWEDNTARCHGKTFTVSRHGITGDHKGSCEWLYTFESKCTNQTASYCYGTCHNDYGYGTKSEESPQAGVTTWIWFKGL